MVYGNKKLQGYLKGTQREKKESTVVSTAVPEFTRACAVNAKSQSD